MFYFGALIFLRYFAYNLCRINYSIFYLFLLGLELPETIPSSTIAPSFYEILSSLKKVLTKYLLLGVCLYELVSQFLALLKKKLFR